MDATLGVVGLPQSATGQACWLTGQNAVRVMGEHFGPQPGPTLQRLLRRAALPVRVMRAGGRAALANSYPPAAPETQAQLEAQARRRSVGSLPFSFQAAGLALHPPGCRTCPPRWAWRVRRRGPP